MRTIGYCTLLYGSDFLEAAIRSVIDAVDALYVLYTPRGSFGHQTDLPCPDSKQELMRIAMRAGRRKLVWHEGVYGSEVAHRDAIYDLAPDADIVLIADADEIWSDGLAQAAIEAVYDTGAKQVKVPISHYWRSLYRAVVTDAWPEVGRVTFRAGSGEAIVTGPGRIHHLGYAQRSEVAYFKQFTHGHFDEWRWDWYDTKWQPNAQVDVHPVIHGFWNPQSVDPFALGLPEWMREHPYAGLEVIP